MRRLVAIAVAALVVAGGGVAVAKTTAVGVGLHEYRLAPYRDRVLPGTVKFNVFNKGEDPHDFVVRTRRGRVVASSGEIRPGERATLRVRFPHAGRYVLVCTLGDHEQLGMKARLTISRRNPSP